MMVKVWASYPDYLASPEFDELRQAALARDGNRCRVCNSKRRLEPHHRRYDRRGWAYDDLENLTTLCRSCHERHHNAAGLGDFLAPALVVGLTGFALGWLACLLY